MYDVIVIGARCAGSPTAMLLARQGYKVLLVDRARFPSEIPHGHVIHQHGPRRLHKWGLLDRIVTAGCPPISAVTTDFGDFPLTGRDLVVNGIALGYAPRRALLDKILVDAAVEAGVELREGFAVQDIVADGDRITGIRGRDVRTGAVVTERATLTVGADGRNSHLARHVKAPVYEAVPALTCYYFSYWSGLPDNDLKGYVRNKRIIFGFPTNGGHYGLFIAWPAAELPTVRADIERQFLAVVDLVPELAERVRNGRREERFYGATDLPNFYRKPYGPGWALVGDAGCHKDPYMALGMCDALRDADWLVEAVGAGLGGWQPLEMALEEYERRRNKASASDYQRNLASAQFLPMSSDLMRLRAALSGNSAATNQFYMAGEGMIAPETFFNPENLQRLVPAADTSPGTGSV